MPNPDTPRKSSLSPRNTFAVFRCSPAERDALRLTALRMGISVSELIRRRLRRDLAHPNLKAA